mgnify:CR=1 FL=1
MIPLGFERPGDTQAAVVRVARLAELDADDMAAWTELTETAGADNPFASDYFTRAVLTHFDPRRHARLFIVADNDGFWLGVLAAEPAPRFGRMPMPHWRSVLNANQFVGGPLVRQGREHAFWAVLLPALDEMAAAGTALALPMLAEEHRVTRALIEHCAVTGRAAVMTGRIARAMMRPVQCPVILPPKRRARLASLERRLATDHGPIRYAAVMEGEAERWIAAFLTMEAAGWKGRAGSAVASRPDSAALFADVMQAALATGRAAARTLFAGDRPVAMSAYFLSDGYGLGFKCCYDEEYAAYAPGILLLRDIVGQRATTAAQWFDSCSAPEEATINALWPDRRSMIDLCVATGSGSDWPFRAAMGARDFWHRLKGGA